MNGIALTVLISQLPKLFGFSIDSDGPAARPVRRSARRCSPARRTGPRFARRRRHAGGDPAAQALQAHPGHPDRGGRRDGRGRRASTSADRRREGARADAAGPAVVRAPVDRLRRPRAGRDRRLRRGDGVVRRHQRAVAHLRRADRAPTSIPNQEMVGLGAANLAAGLFQGFPISSSSSRTPVAEAAGAKTQLTGVVGALAVALLLVAGAEPAAEPAQQRAGRGGDRRGDRPVRVRRPAPHLPHPALGVLAVDRLLRRRRGVRARSPASAWRS